MRLRSGNRKASGRRARRPFGDDRAAGADLGPQRRVLLGVRRVGPVADHRQRTGIGMGECASVGRAVDALRQARHDSDPERRQFEPELGGRLTPSLGGVAGADDPDATRIEHRQVATDEQHRRRPRVVEQRRRVPRVVVCDHRGAGVDAALPALGRITEPAIAPPRLGERVVLRQEGTDTGRWWRVADGHMERGDRVVVRQQRRQACRGHAIEAGERGEVSLGWSGGRATHAARPCCARDSDARSSSANAASASEIAALHPSRRSAMVRATRRTR